MYLYTMNTEYKNGMKKIKKKTMERKQPQSLQNILFETLFDFHVEFLVLSLYINVWEK